MSETPKRGSSAVPALAFGAVLLLAIVAGNLYGRGAVMIVLAGGAIVLAIAFFWFSIQSLTGSAALSLDEALGLGAPSSEEERKQSVLRILKDLEYELAVGKLSEEDYQVLSKKYRAEAKSLLQLLDTSLTPARERAEQLLKERLESLASKASSSDPASAEGNDDASAEDNDDASAEDNANTKADPSADNAKEIS